MRLCMSLFFSCLSSVWSEDDRGEWKEVNIKQGPVRGYRDPSAELWTFYGIPYATAPTDKDKFKPPLPPPIWTEPLDAVDNSIICPQFYRRGKMEENCLVANIYVPVTAKQNLSVLVHIHGGGYQVGYSNMLTLKDFMAYMDFIIVNFNYRLGIHGFLCLGTADVPGNAGMKDQVALLRWVQENIADFGGNPNDVTISGYSAGSSSVELLMLSKAADGLFHKLILESGTSLSPMAIQTNPLEIAKSHARKLNFTDADDIFALEEFYKTLPMDILTSDGFFYRTDSTFKFSPCVESAHDGAFLTESPLTVLKKGDYTKLPAIYGFAKMEGLLNMDMFDAWKDAMNVKFSDFLPAGLEFPTELEKEAVAKTVKEFYFGDRSVCNETVLHYVDYFSDVFFIQSILWVVKLRVEGGDDQVYLYEYSFVDENTPKVPYTDVQGANHVSESYCLADNDISNKNQSPISKEYKDMKKIMRDIYHNFIITGKPIPEASYLPAWPPVRVETSPHMSLGNNVELREAYVPERFEFWQNIYQKYYKDPMEPSHTPHKEL